MDHFFGIPIFNSGRIYPSIANSATVVTGAVWSFCWHARWRVPGAPRDVGSICTVRALLCPPAHVYRRLLFSFCTSRLFCAGQKSFWRYSHSLSSPRPPSPSQGDSGLCFCFGLRASGLFCAVLQNGGSYNRTPFLRWDTIRNPSAISKRRVLYYLETAQGEQVVAALQIRGQDNRLVYEPFAPFLKDYQALLNLGDVSVWSYGFELNAWLDDLVYHSFVRYSEKAVDQCWYMKDFSLPVLGEGLPRSLRQHFEADGSSTWVILRHGLKAWTVEIINHGFRNGWDVFRQAHGLKGDHKVVFGCNRKWVFHTIMFDADGHELVFGWSGPNGRWQDLPPLAGGVRTACLPSTLAAQNAVVKFVYFNVYGPDLRTEIETRLRYVFKMLELEQMVVKMADHTWIVPIHNLRLDVDAFNQLAASLYVQFLNHIMFVMLPTAEFRVIVFDGRYDSERMYDWF